MKADKDKDAAVIDLVDDSENDSDDNDTKLEPQTPAVLANANNKASKSTLPGSNNNKSLIVWDQDGAIENDAADVFLQRRRAQQSKELFEDANFLPHPSSIRGAHSNSKASVSRHPNCRCRGGVQAKLTYKPKTGRPYHHCGNNSTATTKCSYFAWAYQAEQLQWYRFGKHTGHTLVRKQNNHKFCSADDLCQGKVGDCWFLSALAVVAERPDLIRHLLFGNNHNNIGNRNYDCEEDGLVQVNLFVDGYWKTVAVDNFLPCMIDAQSEDDLRQALQASAALLLGSSHYASTFPSTFTSSSSKYNPHALADSCTDVLRETKEFLEHHQQKTLGRVLLNDKAGFGSSFKLLQRSVTSQDLAYSKAHHQQLWVPFLEKAYAKSHGSYQAISGGHIAEAFLDLTGAPTLVHDLHSGQFQPRQFWYKLLHYRKQKLPMGCGTNSSAVGIVGMHAYSILDVQELQNVDYRFFQETGVAHGNVSGFTEYDGRVRLLRVRNPHGQGEWKGAFSDHSDIWERLLEHSQKPPLKSTASSSRSTNNEDDGALTRSMKNDGTFWIDYDNFLLAFSNVDVVLAFLGNHAKSLPANFPAKKSNHRCARAFEVSLLLDTDDEGARDAVELYILGIQKTRRGASHGRADRKKSYKVCDLGMLVGQPTRGDDAEDHETSFSTVQGEMFGFRRNGHYRCILSRKTLSRVVVMPISFGHPAATDKELPFVLRFVSDAPLLIRELEEVPRMDIVMQMYCMSRPTPNTKQGIQTILLEESIYRLVQVDCRGNGGGTIFLYLCINGEALQEHDSETEISFSVEANCRGMSCRTESGLLEHETVAKGKKFEAAWRRYALEVIGESKSRLLLVLYQSGQDTEFGSIKCKRMATPRKLGGAGSSERQRTILQSFGQADESTKDSSSVHAYEERGIFNGVNGNSGFLLSGQLSESHASPAGFGGDIPVEIEEDELERALAISRGDLELQQALELSRQQTTPKQGSSHFDTDLQRALELSKVERTDDDISVRLASAPSATRSTKPARDDDLERAVAESKKFASKPPAMSYDDELSKAIQLSMQETQPPLDRSQKKQGEDVVDLTEEEDATTKRKRTDKDTDDDLNPVDLAAAKRKLAAQAAMRRMS